MSPEQFQQKHYDEKVDVFAYGTLLWEIFAEEVPWDGLELLYVRKDELLGASACYVLKALQHH